MVTDALPAFVALKFRRIRWAKCTPNACVWCTKAVIYPLALAVSAPLRVVGLNPLPATDPRLVVGYLRTSSAEQGRAYGPESQRAAVRAFAKREGLVIVAEFHEDVSGTVPLEDRPGLSDALAALYQHGAGGLLVAERTRLARDEFAAHDAMREFRAAGARVLYADGSNGDDDSALLLDGIGHVIAAHDRRRIVARLKAGRDAKEARHPEARAQGGRLPHGYRRTRSGLVEVDPDAAAEVVRIFQLVLAGASIRATAETMTTETGRTWRPTVVDRIVRRDIYKLAKPGRIIDPRLWNATQAALASRRRRHPTTDQKEARDGLG
jgi:DNA invertase Pin-like site-specific DNA recombinase